MNKIMVFVTSITYTVSGNIFHPINSKIDLCYKKMWAKICKHLMLHFLLFFIPIRQLEWELSEIFLASQAPVLATENWISSCYFNLNLSHKYQLIWFYKNSSIDSPFSTPILAGVIRFGFPSMNQEYWLFLRLSRWRCSVGALWMLLNILSTGTDLYIS